MLAVKHTASSSWLEPPPSARQLLLLQDTRRAAELEGRSLGIAGFTGNKVHRQLNRRP